eukprot:TRINITY_DN1491_c0_g1_i1.p1 TRINITY_DN1491_c0_g1~~TRINITY_DN1491_c0_g1_i1.p1  ORF type:complete len:180 (-),score=32.30 TRINITY_DN1491_c0_g1_i1:417-956(-)
MKFFLSAAALSLGAVADTPAGPNLAYTMMEIVKKKRENTFHTGEVITDRLESKKEEVGACLLDKVDAILHQNAVKVFRNDLLIDLAACCMKDIDACGRRGHMDRAYSFIYKKEPAFAACHLMLEAKKRFTDLSRMTKRVQAYFHRWQEVAKLMGKEMEPFQCSMGLLTGKDTKPPSTEL